MTEARTSAIAFWIFSFAFLCSFMMMYQQIMIRENFVVFTDEATVPEATDFYASLFGGSDTEE